jgi:enamine deaminase RidA (YjgF/YER057c/UK114 family)
MPQQRYWRGQITGRAGCPGSVAASENCDDHWEDIVRRTVYTTMPTEFETITGGIDEVTGGAEHPAPTIAGVSGLALPGLLIEIEATASV